MRASKLSTSMSRNLRSATGGKGSLGLPDRSDSTPMTNGSCTFFSAPYSSTSYSICTLGARLRAMNFWLLMTYDSSSSSTFARCGRTSLALLCTRLTARIYGRPVLPSFVLVAFSGHHFDLFHTVGRQILQNIDEIEGYQLLGA